MRHEHDPSTRSTFKLLDNKFFSPFRFFRPYLPLSADSSSSKQYYGEDSNALTSQMRWFLFRIHEILPMWAPIRVWFSSFVVIQGSGRLFGGMDWLWLCKISDRAFIWSSLTFSWLNKSFKVAVLPGCFNLNRITRITATGFHLGYWNSIG